MALYLDIDFAVNFTKVIETLFYVSNISESTEIVLFPKYNKLKFSNSFSAILYLQRYYSLMFV